MMFSIIFSVAHLNLALCFSSQGRKEVALEILLRAATRIDDDGLKDPKAHKAAQATSAFNAAKILVELRRPREAIPVLHTVHSTLNLAPFSFLMHPHFP